MTDNEKSGTPDNDEKIRALGARWQTAIDAERAGRPPPPDEPENYINEMAIDVVNTPGTTLDGALTKLRIALHYNREDGDGDNAYPLGDGTIMRAVVGDLERVISNEGSRTAGNPAPNTDTPHPDADLLALAAEHSELIATMARLGWSDGSGQDHEWQGAMEHCSDLERAIIDATATTLDGMRVKARIFYLMMDERPEECTDLDPGSMLFSLIRDLLGEEDFAEAGKERDRRIACDRAMDEKSKGSLQ